MFDPHQQSEFDLAIGIVARASGMHGKVAQKEAELRNEGNVQLLGTMMKTAARA